MSGPNSVYEKAHKKRRKDNSTWGSLRPLSANCDDTSTNVKQQTTNNNNHNNNFLSTGRKYRSLLCVCPRGWAIYDHLGDCQEVGRTFFVLFFRQKTPRKFQRFTAFSAISFGGGYLKGFCGNLDRARLAICCTRYARCGVVQLWLVSYAGTNQFCLVYNTGVVGTRRRPLLLHAVSTLSSRSRVS